MHTLLIPVQTSTYFPELFRAAHYLHQAHGCDALFILYAYPNVQQQSQQILAAGMRVQMAADLFPLRPPTTRLGRLAGRILRRISRPLWEEWHTLRQRQQRILTLLRAERITVVLQSADNIDYDTALYIQAAHQLGLRAYVHPSWMASPREPGGAYLHSPAHQQTRWQNRLLVRWQPRWGYTHDATPLTRLPAEKALARHLLGIAPARPWVLHSGAADALLLESEAMYAYGIAQGLPAAQMRVTGTLAHDELAAGLADAPQLRRQWCADQGLIDDRPLLLTGLPPDFHYMRGAPSEFPTYADLVAAWVQTLVAQAPQHQVVVTLHPSMAYADYQSIEAWGARLTTQPTLALIPLCDAYVAMISSTIQWAIACGKPVINYDVYGFRYPDYEDVPGVLRVERLADLAARTHQLCTDAAFYTKVAAQQRAAAPYWGVLDGRAGARLAAALLADDSRTSER